MKWLASGLFALLAEPVARLGDRWENLTADSHKFDAGDILILKNKGSTSHGSRAVVEVLAYRVEQDEFGKQGQYHIAIHRDVAVDNPERIVDHRPDGTPARPDGLAKIIVERHFAKANVDTVDDALVLYEER